MEFDLQTLAWTGLTCVLLAVIVVLALCLRRLHDAFDHRATGLRITVEVGNPLELARARTRLGAQLGRVAPHIVTRRVHAIIARELDAELAGRGVDARVTVDN